MPSPLLPSATPTALSAKATPPAATAWLQTLPSACAATIQPPSPVPEPNSAGASSRPNTVATSASSAKSAIGTPSESGQALFSLGVGEGSVRLFGFVSWARCAERERTMRRGAVLPVSGRRLGLGRCRRGRQAGRHALRLPFQDE